MSSRTSTVRSVARRRLLAVVAAVAAAAVAIPSVGALAADPTPRVAFVARNDVPFDSLALGPVAGALGGIVVITSPGELVDSAREALVAFEPDRVYIAGGEGAITPAVEDAVEDAGGWMVERISGDDRNATAAALAALYADLGVGRPLLTDGNVSGDVELDGMLSAQRLDVVEDTFVAAAEAQDADGQPTPLNAPIPARTVIFTAPAAGVVTVNASIVLENTTGAAATFTVVAGSVARSVAIGGGDTAAVDLLNAIDVDAGEHTVQLFVIRNTGMVNPLPVAWDDATLIAEYTPAHQSSFTSAS